MTNPLESIKLPLPNQEEKKQTVSSPSNSDNPLATIRQDLQEPSNIRKYQYGWAKEDMVLGDLWDIGHAWIDSFGPLTYEESVKKVNEEKKQKLYAEFPEFAGGKYDADAATMAGSISTMVADPVYLLMPWARAAQGANLLVKGSKLAALGAGVGAGDSIIRQKADTGQVDIGKVGTTAMYGAVLSPVAMGGQKLIGKGLEKAFPNLFKSSVEKKAIQAINEGNFVNKNNLNQTQLQKIKNISDKDKTKQLYNELQATTNYHDLYVKPILELTDQLNSVNTITKLLKDKNTKKLFTNLEKIANEQKNNVFLTKGTKPYKFDILKFDSVNGKTLKSVTPKDLKDNKVLQSFKKEMYEKAYEARTQAIKANQKYLEHLSVELYNAMGFTERTMKNIMAAAIRPVVTAGGFGTAGLIGGAEDDTIEALMWSGAVLGGLSKVLTRSGIKGIPAIEQTKFAKFIPQYQIDKVDKFIRVNLATTTATRLSNRNTVMDRFSVEMFPRFTDTVRTNIIGKPVVGSDDAIGLANVSGSVEERAINQLGFWTSKISNKRDGGLLQNADAQTQADAIKIVRGFTGETSLESRQLSERIINYLKEFKNYYQDVGIIGAKDISYYFPRKLNFKLIEASPENKERFLKGVAQAYINTSKKKLTMEQALKKAKTYYEGNKGAYDNLVITDGNIKSFNTLKQLKGTDDDIVLPISRHIKHQRELEGSYEKVESLFEEFLINDVATVLDDLVHQSVKSVEFARTFGADGRLLKGYLADLRKLYKGQSRDTDTDKYTEYLNKQHKGDVGHLQDAINGYFGVFGSKLDDTSRGITAIVSTLANFNLMERVAIANIGDLSQGFQNSRYFWSWISGLPGLFGKGATSQIDDAAGVVAKNALREYNPADVTAKIGGVQNQSFISLLNQGFFKYTGLTKLTQAARRYVYNVGAIDTHRTAQNLFKTSMRQGTKDLNTLTDKKSLADLAHLKRMGVIKVTNNGRQITNSEEILKLGAYNSVIDAEKDIITRSVINKAGSLAANRDAIIPQVGNRLLFTQSRNPWMRLIGQYSSWAMAKSAQTNAMIQRIENGNARQLIGMLGAMVVFGGIKDLRNFVTTGEFKTARTLKDSDEWWWLSQANQFSGNLGWLPTTAANMWLYRTGSTPVEFFPGVQIFNDYVDLLLDLGASPFSEKAWDNFTKNALRNAPLPTLRNLTDMLFKTNIGSYKKDINYRTNYGVDKTKEIGKKNLGFVFNKGGLADQTRMLFSEGDVVDKSFSDAFAEARGNRQELFEWQGNQYTTRRADENDLQYQNFLGKKTDNKVLLKEVPEPEPPADAESFKQVTENIIIPKKKPILKKEKPNKSKFSFFSSAEAAIPDDKQEIEVNAKKFLEKDIQPKDVVETNKFGWNNLINKIPPNVRLMVNDVFKQSTDGKFDKVFTEKNLNQEYQSILKSIALDVLSKGKTNIEYADYKSVEGDNAYADVSYTAKGVPDITDKRFNLKTSLGQATIKIDGDGNLIIVDKFNFNDSADINSFTDFYQMVKEIGGSALQGEGYNLVRKVGKWFGSPEGEGQTVRINLGKVDLSKFKNVKIAKASKGGVIRQQLRGGGASWASARSAMTSNRAYSGGGQRHNPHTSSGYSKTSNKGGGNGGSSSNNNNNNNTTVKSSSTNTTTKRKDKKIRVDTNVPVPGDNKKDIKNKFESIFNEEQLQVKGEYRTDGLLSPSDSFKIGATGYIGLESAGNSITDFTPETGAKFTADYVNDNINTGVAYDTNYNVGTFEFQKKFDSGVNLNTSFDTEGNKFIGASFNFKKGGLLDKKRG